MNYCHPFTGACNQSENCPVRETPFPPLDLADSFPLRTGESLKSSAPKTRPAQTAIATSRKYTLLGWGITALAVIAFFTHVYRSF